MTAAAKAACAVLCVALGAAGAVSAQAPPGPAKRPGPDPATVRAMLGQLADGDWIMAYRAMGYLGQWKVAAAAGRLAEILKVSRSPWMRGRALVALAQIRGPAVLAQAVDLSAQDDVRLRRAGIEALEIIGTPAGVEALRKRLEDTDEDLRYLALAAWAHHRRAQAWPLVQKHVAELPKSAYRQAARALAHVGTDDARKRVWDLYSRARHNEMDILRGLGEVRDRRLIPLLLRFVRTREPSDPPFRAVVRSLRLYDPDDLADHLRTLLASGDTGGLEASTWLAANVCPNAELGDRLAAVLAGTPDLPDENRRQILKGLLVTRMRPERHQELYRDYLRHDDPVTRALAIQCLGRCPQADLYTLLADSVSDTEVSVAMAAMSVLGRTPPDTAPKGGIVAYLDKPLRSSDPRLLTTTMTLLARAGRPSELGKAAALLDGVLGGTNDALRASAAGALGKLAGYADVADVVAHVSKILVDRLVVARGGAFPVVEDHARAGRVLARRQRGPRRDAQRAGVVRARKGGALAGKAVQRRRDLHARLDHVQTVGPLVVGHEEQDVRASWAHRLSSAEPQAAGPRCQAVLRKFPSVSGGGAPVPPPALGARTRWDGPLRRPPAGPIRASTRRGSTTPARRSCM